MRKDVEVSDNPVCKRCGRKLKNPTSRELGFGEVCYKKWIKESENKKLFTSKKE